MTKEFVMLPTFERSWKDIGLNNNDLYSLRSELTSNQKAGHAIKKTNGLKYLYISFENDEKIRGGTVCYVDFADYEKIYLIVAFSENIENYLSKKKLNEIADRINQLKSTVEGNEDK